MHRLRQGAAIMARTKVASLSAHHAAGTQIQAGPGAAASEPDLIAINRRLIQRRVARDGNSSFNRKLR
jgi:hypothetical protein